MLKIRLIKELGLGVATLGVASGSAGCGSSGQAEGASSADDTQQGPQTQAEQPIAPGTGTIAMQTFALSYASTSGGDEFIRVGETLSVSIPFDEVSYYACQNPDCTDPTSVNESNVAATAVITYFASTGAIASTLSLPITWGNGGIGTTKTFVIPTAIRYFTVSFTVTNLTTNTTVPLTEYSSYNRFAVFGAFLPSKEILFDNNAQGQTRQRVIEGGPLAAGANVTLSYSDWRANTFVNSDSLNLVIGQGTTETRFGPQSDQVLGTLSYNIQAVYSEDGGDTWDTVTLTADPSPDSLQDALGRTAYEATIALPNGATDFRVAFHIQAILTASPQYGQYVTQWYQSPNGSTFQLGQQFTIADTWDNNGASDGNYDFVVTATGN